MITVRNGQRGLSATSRTFRWQDGVQAVPLALYDDARLGFFLRGPGDDARLAAAAAEIVFAGWEE